MRNPLTNSLGLLVSTFEQHGRPVRDCDLCNPGKGPASFFSAVQLTLVNEWPKRYAGR
jgi:hypothetical protein